MVTIRSSGAISEARPRSIVVLPPVGPEMAAADRLGGHARWPEAAEVVEGAVAVAPIRTETIEHRLGQGLVLVLTQEGLLAGRAFRRRSAPARR